MNYLKTFLPYLFGNKKGKSLDLSLPDPIPWSSLCFEEILMFHALKNSLNQYIHSIDLKNLNRKDVFHLFNFLHLMNDELKMIIKNNYKNELKIFNEAINPEKFSTKHLQDLLNFKNDKLTVFAILKKDRNELGRLVIRQPDGRFVTDACKNIWSIPILGLSSRGLPFHHSNGATPAGIYKLESVMPHANKVHEYGEFRRLIINFLDEVPNEAEFRKYLPSNHHELSWWKPAVLAHELGRSLLRIHGTGRANRNPFTRHFPFVPTSGCLATNEAKFLGFKHFRDQRLLLDTLMSSLNLAPTSENESKIHGLLYVVELDDNLSALHFLA